MAESQLVSIDPDESTEITAFKLGRGSQSAECPEHGFHERDIRSLTMVTNQYESLTFILPMSVWEVFKDAINNLDDVDT